MTQPGFWDDTKEAKRISKRDKQLERKIDKFRQLEEDYDELLLLCEMAIEEAAEYLAPEIEEKYEQLSEQVEEMRLNALLDGEYDDSNAIVDINSGTGGLDAQDWAEMLLRMYNRWAESKGFEVELLNILKDKAAGIKSATILVKGEYAFGYLRSEKGVHRLVRVSPFDSSGKRHTSFASVDVMPELDDDIELEIDENNLKIDTYRASGAGGQHVNTTDSAVRITHEPTGIVVQCQNERSQLSNKKTALKMLKAKLIELKAQEQKDEIEDLMGDYSEIAWGNQIRSYVFNPYSLVKDHRTNVEIGNVQGVMDGDIDKFIDEYLKKSKES
jgi:peptide chain release factor 2